MQPVVSNEGTHRSTPRAHKTPTLTANPQGKKKKQSNRLEPESHKDNLEHIDDYNDKDDKKVDEEEGAGSENRPPMPNKENYVSWSSRLLRYAKSRPNGKLIYNSIINGSYFRRIIPKPEWSRHVTIVHQKKDLHTADYTQMYDFLKYNQKEEDELRAERLAKTQDPLALMAKSNNPFNFQVFHPDLPLSTNQNRNGNIVVARAEGNANGNNGNQISKHRHQALRVTKLPSMDSDGSAEVDRMNDLSNPVTSNSIPTTKESKVIENDKVIAPGMSRIYPFKNSREAKSMPNKPVNASVRTNLITDPQPHVITKKVANVYNIANQMKHKAQIWKPKNVGSKERLASPKPSKPRMRLRLSKYVCGASNQGNILITRVYFVEGLGYNLFSAGQFYDLDLEVAFRRNTCFARNLKGVDLLKGNRTTNLYTINLHDMASASPICLMARATSTKLWLWHQRLSHLNFDTKNDVTRNDLVTGLSKFKYHKEHPCPSCEQGKGKRASHPHKPIPNSKQRLHLLHMDLCGPMRIANINGKWYVLVIIDDYSRYTCVVFLRSKDKAPEEIKIFLKKITVLLQAPAIIVRTDNGTKFMNQVLQEYFNSVGISHQASSVCTPQQNRAKAIATAKPDISFLYVFGALFYPKNDCEDIEKLGVKGYIGFFIGYSANSCAYRVYNRRTKKIMETMNVTFDELSAMVFEQRRLKPGLQSMTSGQISSGLDLPYASSIITSQKPTEGELDLLFEAMYDDHIGGQPSTAPRTILAAQAPQVLQTPTATTTTADTASIPTNSSS
nr:retrovirus-related Pol polyprotein from transposon TNT 1-94 [Tanacetum cinerariifolium]